MNSLSSIERNGGKQPTIEEQQAKTPVEQIPGGRGLMVFETAIESIGFLAARILYGAVLGYLALGNLIALDESVAYARSKGAPKPEFGVPLGSLLLLSGSVSIITGVFPILGAFAVILFLVGITPIMHDFWAINGQEAQNEQIHFLKNIGLVAGALVFLLLADQAWPYAIGITI